MSFSQDIKFGIRMLLRDPGFTAVMVAALALGIGVNTTIFTLVNAVLFRGLPFEQSHRVMYVASNNPSKNETDIGISYPDFRDWQAQTKTFKGLAAYRQQQMVVTDTSNAPERYSGSPVTANFFSLIGQKTMLGRDMLPEEDRAGAAPVCIIGYTMWESRYGRNPNVLGQTIRINDAPFTVIGVMPKGMKFPSDAELWTPLIPIAEFQKRENRNLQAFGRLADGVTLQQARDELSVIAAQLSRQYPKEDKGITAMAKPYNDKYNGGNIRTVFLVLLGAVGFVLLIACANVANLLLARSLARSREISIRTALGASRWRVIRQLLVESVMVGVLGGAAGLLIAIWGVRMFDLAVANVGKPYWIDFSMDFTVFAYLAGICLVTGILFGLAPAIQLSKVDLNSTLKEGGRGASGGRSRYLSGFLVVTEVALSLVLLVGAGLMIRSFLNIYGMTSGMHAERYLVMRLSLPDKKYPNDDARLKFFDQLEPKVLATPGVESAAFASHLPVSGSIDWRVEIEGKPLVEEEKQPRIESVVVSPTYFQTMNIPLLRGRTFTNGEGLPDKSVVIVNQRFAAKYWPNQDPIGKRIRMLWDGLRPWHTVIAVAQDFRQGRPDEEAIEPLIYIPYRGKPLSNYAFLVRAAVNPTSLTSAIRKQIQWIDSNLTVFGAMTLEESLDQQRWPFRVFGTLFAVFALIALLLSSVGLYAVMSYAVTRRTREIGVRMAMGASGGSILYLVLAQGIRQLAIGLAIGLTGAFGLARVMKSLLIQVTPTDPITFVAISGILIAVGVCACWIPARSAMKVDPLVALRYE
jgi:putative ABC transport system permease protein